MPGLVPRLGSGERARIERRGGGQVHGLVRGQRVRRLGRRERNGHGRRRGRRLHVSEHPGCPAAAKEHRVPTIRHQGELVPARLGALHRGHLALGRRECATQSTYLLAHQGVRGLVDCLSGQRREKLLSTTQLLLDCVEPGGGCIDRLLNEALALGAALAQLRDRLAQALRRLQQRLRRLRKLGGRLGRYAQRLLARLSRLGLPPLGGRTHGAHKGVEAQSKHELALAGDEGRSGRHLRPADGRLVSCESNPCEEGLRQRRVLVPRHELGRELKAPLGCRARLVAPRVEEGLDEQLGLAGELCQHAHVRALALLLAAPHESRPREPAAREQAVLCA